LNYILSTGRTGSTLLSTMLNMNSRVLSISEEPFSLNLFGGYAGKKNWDRETVDSFINDFFLFSIGKLGPQFGTRADLEKSFADFVGQIDFEIALRLAYLCFFPEKDKSRIESIVDKELIFHTELGRLARQYPDSKFIILLRDPRDNALVKLKRGVKLNATHSLQHYATVWKVNYSLLHMQAMRLPKGRALYVRYEDLVSEPEKELRTICNFLDVPFENEMLEYDTHVKKELSENPKKLSENVIGHFNLVHEGLTKKTYKDKIGFWKTGLTPSQSDLIWTIDRNLAMDLGYTEEREGFTPVKLGVRYFFYYLWFIVNRVWKVRLYYDLPFRIRRSIKRFKYKKKHLASKYTEEEYLKKNLYQPGKPALKDASSK
jgi:hypothetical protein